MYILVVEVYFHVLVQHVVMCMYVCMYVRTYVCMYVRTYLCTYVRTYVYTVQNSDSKKKYRKKYQ